MSEQKRTNRSKLAALRGFNPTKEQADFIDQHLSRTGVPFSRVVDAALREYFEHRGHTWPAKYNRRPSVQSDTTDKAS